MRPTVVEHTDMHGKKRRWCTMCWLHVNLQNEIDLDYYTARQYVNYLAVPIQERCKHQIDIPEPKTNKELLIEIGDVDMTPAMRMLLAGIVRRLP